MSHWTTREATIASPYHLLSSLSFKSHIHVSGCAVTGQKHTLIAFWVLNSQQFEEKL